jgi:methylated-DNA-[protein]-cysteine S-methyltransferase
MTLASSIVDTPLGPFVIFATDRAVRAARWAAAPSAAPNLVSERAALRVARYFAGDLGALGAIDVDPEGTTFQKQVWRALRRLGPCETLAYGALARALGVPRGARAIASANARNPISLIVPCHRVIGSDGALAGYSGGLVRKRWLLAHEKGEAPERREQIADLEG